MLVDFLDALGIAHKEGVVEIARVNGRRQTPRRRGHVLGKYPAEVVAVYFSAFSEMNDVSGPT